MYCLPVLEATSLKSRCLQDHTPSSGSGEISFLASNQPPEALHIPWLCLRLHIPFSSVCVSPVCLSHIELRAHPDIPGSPAHLKVLDHFCKNPFSKKLHVHRLQGLGCEHASGGHCSAHYKHRIRKQYNHGHFPHVVHAWWVVSVMSDSAILWMIAQQVSLWDFCKQKYWNGLPCPSPEDLPNPRIEPCLLHLLHGQVDSLPLAPPGNSQALKPDARKCTIFCCSITLLSLFWIPHSSEQWTPEFRECRISVPGMRSVRVSISWGGLIRCSLWSAVCTGHCHTLPNNIILSFSGLWPCRFSILQGT